MQQANRYRLASLLTLSIVLNPLQFARLRAIPSPTPLFYPSSLIGDLARALASLRASYVYPSRRLISCLHHRIVPAWGIGQPPSALRAQGQICTTLNTSRHGSRGGHLSRSCLASPSGGPSRSSSVTPLSHVPVKKTITNRRHLTRFRSRNRYRTHLSAARARMST